MQTSIFLAKLMGPLMVVMTAAILLNREHFKKAIEEGINSPISLLIAGSLTLVTGLAIVNTHNVWAFDWRVIITVFGWLAIVGGVIRIALPKLVHTIGEKALESWSSYQIFPVTLFGLLGLYLTYQGYLA